MSAYGDDDPLPSSNTGLGPHGRPGSRTVTASMPPESLRRILIRLPNWVGDMMMALPAIQSLLAARPEARLFGMARPEHLELAQRIPALEEIITAAPRAGADRQRAVWTAARTLRNAHFDAAILLAPSFEAALTVWLAGIPIRVGHDTDHRTVLLNRVVDVRDGHRMDGFDDLVSELGAKPANGGGGLACTAADRAYADRLFERAGFGLDDRPIFVNPAAAKKPRAWSSDRFLQLADVVAERHAKSRVLVHDHAPFAPPAGWPSSASICLVSGASLVELAGLLGRCSLYVGNDSGPMHIAAALGVPTIGIYGSSSPERTSPRGLKGAQHISISASFACSPCRERFFDECPSPPTPDERPPCLNEISVEMVADAVDRVLSSQGSG